MKKVSLILITLIFMVSSSWADITCPADSSYHIDMRTMLPDGSPNPTYGLEISTGLCACVNFINGVDITGSEVTFTINIVDNEPIRGIELDIFHDFSDLTYSGVSRGEKLQELVNDEGNPTSDMTILGNWIEDHVKVLAYSVNRARTEGNGMEGNLLHLAYTLADGASLPENISFYFTVVNIPGTSLNPELLNVVCSYPSQDSPAVVNTTVASADQRSILPSEYALFQNYPNPFNPSTQITFDVPASEFVMLRVFNLLGQDVHTLINKAMTPGRYTVEWNGNDMLNNEVASGVYFYELRGKSFISRKKMLLIR
ncbi:MAG: T9SS type A sorting domain-containing protein [Candidatus Neomarinimicrobiota bacterium]|nr:T9SS type A sorting domain-containing protein [Candidatus Neomarinimicrobiota bacterium]